MAANPTARQLGLHPGLALADAHARVPGLRIVPHDAGADRALRDRIADWCERYTPTLAFDSEDGLILEIAGSVHLFGGEEGLKADLEQRLARLGFHVRTAITKTSEAAHALARHGKASIVPDAQSADAAKRLPIAALECAPDTLLTLRRAGLYTIGDLADRPRKPLAARFGHDLTTRLAKLLGEHDQPITPRRPLPLFQAEQRFAEPIGLEKDIEHTLADLAQRVCADLARHGQGGRCFEASFFRTDGQVRRLETVTGQAMRDPAQLLHLIGLRLDRLADPLDPGFGFDMIRLAVVAGDDLIPAAQSFDGEQAAEEAVAALVDRLAARLGLGAIERLIPQDSHWPERAERAVSALSDETIPTQWPSPPAGAPPRRPLFLFHPPEVIETVAEVPDGPPRRFRWRRVLHEVTRAEGPERIAPEWWRMDERPACTRDYFRVEDHHGRRFWLFREGLYGREPGPVRWFIHGLFP